MADQSSPNEYTNAIVASFDKSLRSFSFNRTIPIAIYVDAGDESANIGRRYAEIVTSVFNELGFSVKVLRIEDGSFCQLNICESRVPLDEPSLRQRLGHAAETIRRFLDSPIAKGANLINSAAVVVIAIGTLAQFAYGEHEQAIRIGDFTIPAAIWTVLLASKETKSFIKDCREFFTDSKVFKNALRKKKELRQGKRTVVVDGEQFTIRKLPNDKDERIKLLEEKVKELQKDIDDLKSE